MKFRKYINLDFDLSFRLKNIIDVDWYLTQNSDVAKSGIDPIQHWMQFGYKENRAPNHFFDPVYYKESFPDYLELEISCIEHYLMFGFKLGKQPSEYFPLRFNEEFRAEYGNEISPLEVFMRDNSNHWKFESIKIASVLEQFNEMKQITPALRYISNQEFQNLSINKSGFPSEIEDVIFKFNNDYELSHNLFRCKTLLLIPHLVLGGSDKYSMFIAESISSEYQMLGLITDSSNITAAQWIPSDFKLFEIYRLINKLNTYEQTLVLKYLIEFYEIKKVIGVGSKLLYETLRNFGEILSVHTEFYLTLFCHDYNDDGLPVSYASDYFVDVERFVKRFISDTKAFPVQLMNEYGFPESYLPEKFKTIYSCLELAGEYERIPETSYQNRILWAARGDKQKNLPLLAQVAKEMPDLEFHVFGAGDFTEIVELNLSNIKIKGPYKNFTEIDFDRYAAYLYTSLWDGLPISLLEAGARKIPIVTSVIGGVPELFNEKNSWLCYSLNKPDEYINAIRTIIEEPDLASTKADYLLREIYAKHNKLLFRNSLLELIS